MKIGGVFMYVGFSSSLKKASRFRIGAGMRLTTKTLLIFGIFILVYYMIYYSVLLCLWTLYGVCWLFFYLPYKGIAAAVKKSKEKKQGVPL